jgi:pimeloyl-ACP methyl ester carboxylesterase
MRALGVLIVALVAAATAVQAANRWEGFTRPPPLPAPQLEGRVEHDGARIWFATFGAGPPVILLHGAGGASDNFGGQVPALVAAGRRVVVIDSRGQGRSTRGTMPLGYELMETDVIAVMDAIGVHQADIVGWSDGAIVSLVMAMKHPARAGRIFAFSPNMDLKGLRPGALEQPIIGEVLKWAQDDYARLSPTPADFPAAMAAIETMVTTQPDYSAAQLRAIHGPRIAIVDGDHEELIAPAHTRYLARTIPGAKLIILKDVSHFAPLQAPGEFNAAMIAFLTGR